VSCTISDSGLKSTGKGMTRRDAEQQAASAMLEMLEDENE